MIYFRKAVLIIHGLAGGTYDQEKLANFLEVNRKLDVYTFTLPGHDVKSHKEATCKAWIESSEEKLQFLIENGYKEIYLIGHSMGGVIACYLASKYKEVKKLVLAAPAFSHLAAKDEGGFLNALEKSPDLIKAYSKSEFMTRIKKLPLTAVSEFFKLVEKYHDVPKSISVPVMILHGTKDQMVPLSSSLKIFEEFDTNKKELIMIKDYYHDIFKGKKVYIICKEIESFLLEKHYSKKVKIKEI